MVDVELTPRPDLPNFFWSIRSMTDGHSTRGISAIGLVTRLILVTNGDERITLSIKTSP